MLLSFVCWQTAHSGYPNALVICQDQFSNLPLPSEIAQHWPDVNAKAGHRHSVREVNLRLLKIKLRRLRQHHFKNHFELITGQVFSKRIEITSQIHIRKSEQHMAWGQVPCWSALTQRRRTLWMSEMTPSNAFVLKPHVSSNFWMWIWRVISILFEKTWPVIRKIFCENTLRTFYKQRL